VDCCRYGFLSYRDNYNFVPQLSRLFALINCRANPPLLAIFNVFIQLAEQIFRRSMLSVDHSFDYEQSPFFQRSTTNHIS
jgi:hypothetical protein